MFLYRGWFGLCVVYLFILLTGVSFALPNPSAVYCEELGYDYKIIETEKGQEGLCIASNTKFKAGDFFRGKVGQEYSYCARKGYGIKTIIKNGSSSEYAVCLVPDTLYKFSKNKVNNYFNKVKEIPVTEMMGLNEKLNKGFKPGLAGRKKVVSLSYNELLGSPVSLGDSPPSYFDWRDKNGKNWMTPVKNQGGCGSCWAFSAVGAVEAKYNINQNNSRLNPDLSEQYLVSDCCTACGDCSGGLPHLALNYTKYEGISDESCFPYITSNSVCSNRCSDWNNRLWNLSDVDYSVYWWNFTNEELENWTVEKGPLTVAIGISGAYGGYWEGDIYRCTNDSGANHAVVLVGYNDTGNINTSYWILKNSWGSGWNGEGYYKLGFGECNIGDYVHYIDTVNPPDLKPNITLINPLSGYTNENQTIFNFTIYNPIAPESTCDLIINGIINQTNSSVINDTSTIFISNLSEGIHTWNISCWENGIGIVNISETRTLTVDLTNPIITINFPTPDSFLNNKTITINLTAIDANLNYTNISIINSTGAIVNSTINTTNGTYTLILSVQSDGVYNITATVYDLAGNPNLTTIKNITLDTIAPTIASYSIKPKAAINGTNVSITINATDDNLDSTWANVTLPDGNSTIVNPPLNFTLNQIGRYNITFYANDSAGNTASETTHFLSRKGIKFKSEIKDYNNTYLNSTIKFYYNDSEDYENTTDGNFSIQLPDTIFDIEFSAFNNTLKVKLLNINLSANNNKTINLDKFNLSVQGYAVNTSYNFTNSAVYFFYSGINGTDEDHLNLSRCENWSLTNRTCLDNWTILNFTQNKTENYLSANLTGFSGFKIIQELYCGDGICNSSIGETCSNCQQDCGTCPSDDDNGNGGGGSSSSITTSYWIITYVVTEEYFKTGGSRLLSKKQRLKVKVDNKNHYVGIINLTNTTATINISSTPQQSTLSTGEEKKFEVTEDNYYDIYVKLNSITNNIANLTIKKIYEIIVVEEEPIEEMQCNSLYWFDDTSTECGYKEFCGAFMYLGLRTFGTREECGYSLEEIIKERCNEGEERCSDNNLEQCIDNNWIIKEICEYGCNKETLNCNQIPKPNSQVENSLLIVMGLLIFCLIFLAVSTKKPKTKEEKQKEIKTKEEKPAKKSIHKEKQLRKRRTKKKKPAGKSTHKEKQLIKNKNVETAKNLFIKKEIKHIF